MQKLVMTFHANGTMETLRSKVFDPRILGNAEVERISSIEFSSDHQQFYVKWLKGPLSNEAAGERPGAQGGNLFSNDAVACDETGEWLLFDTYEAGVEYEIAAVNHMRLRGASFQ